MTQIPFILVLSRILIAGIIAALTFSEINFREYWIASLILLGVLTDLFDGIIARKLKVATEKLRVWDSNADVVFWLISIASVFYLNLHFLKSNLTWIIVLTASEILVYLVSFLKFKRPVATHTYLAKFWTLTLLIFIVELILTSDSKPAFIICITTGIISRAEIILILILLKKWATDVSSVFAVGRINRG
ncbi:MAG: CDP-alcohol phosphatidyltransferase family protein [Bacteroidetes bacterium]|nr:CDP-alcohol phosphatidyltransferase family protein [Bacteroidota bacterium]